MQSGPAPTAQGSFAKTPLPHLLVYALERGLSGTVEMFEGEASVATLLLLKGFPAKLRTTEGVHYLGDVMLELGLIDEAAHKTSLERMQESPRLQGQILKEMGAVDDARLDAGVRAQLERKLEHLFALPAETVYAYFEGVDHLQRYGGPATPIDPLPVLWRGVRQAAAWEHVDATLRRVGTSLLRLPPTAQVERFGFLKNEMAAIDALKARPMRVVDLANAKIVGPSLAQLLVYFLVITKQLELVAASGVSQQMAAVVAPPQGPAQGGPPSAAGPLSAGQPPQGPLSNHAFARVQLQARPVTRNPLIVEEAPVVTNAYDDRLASVPPPEANVGDPSASVDIVSMITHTIASSLPPPGEEPVAAAVALIPAPPVPESQSAARIPAAPAGLTSEQTGLKQRILERAEKITSQNYFEMLNLSQDATPDEIQRSFFALAKVWHPDRLPAALVDVKDYCSKVFTHLTEAHATLMDQGKRTEYMTLLKDGGATPDDQHKIQAILEAATEFQKAEIVLKRNDTAQAYDLVKRAVMLDPDQADYMALLTWLDAQKPEWLGKEKTLEKIAMLERCLQKNARCERAYFYRGMLYKRIDEPAKAVKDFKKAAELNPRNLDAVREVRLHVMRGGTKPPPAPGAPAPAASARPTKPPPETLGGLFGRLFKK